MLNKDERKKIEREVTRELSHEKNLLIEAKDANGKWVRKEYFGFSNCPRMRIFGLRKDKTLTETGGAYRWT